MELQNIQVNPIEHHLHLVDGSAFIFRAFHAIRPLNRPDGTPVNAVFGFTRMLMKLLRDTDGDLIAVFFDAARRNFRNDIYPDYKGHRPDAPEELVPQFPLIKQVSEALNLHTIEIEGFEADDIIATYARQATEAGAEVTIVSSDKDLMQLVGEKDGARIDMLDTMKNSRIYVEEVEDKFGVEPEKVGDGRFSQLLGWGPPEQRPTQSSNVLHSLELPVPPIPNKNPFTNCAC